MQQELEVRRPQARRIAAGEGWQVSEFVCHLGPDDKPFEEQHEEVSIAAVLAGSFHYRSPAGRALLYPGAFLLGNAGACFTCGHEHARGDRCIAFHFDNELFCEIAASSAGSHRFRFPASMLPATSVPAPVIAEAEAAAAGRAMVEERVIALLEAVLARFSTAAPPIPDPKPIDRRRIGATLRYIEQNFDRSLSLAELASIAGMSRYHFLRTFRRALGTTPYRLVQDMRLRRAALALATTDEPVAAIAFAAGFGDLSTFNARFRTLFGNTPSVFRSQRPRRSSVRASTFASS